MINIPNKEDRAIRIAAQMRTEQDFISTSSSVVSELIGHGIKLAENDYGKAREITTSISIIATSMPHLIYSVGLKTSPGDLVKRTEDDEYTYVFSNSSDMTHSNPLFYPGSNGVYYWSIIPKTKDGYKIFPKIDGIIVNVKQGETWWNKEGTKLYIWNATSWNSCSSLYYPGAAGVHQWLEL